MTRSTTPFRRARTDSPRQLAAFHRSHRGTPVLGCPICTFASASRTQSGRALA